MELLLKEMEQSLTCAICMNVVTYDACFFNCKGQHTHCVECIVSYVDNMNTDASQLKCSVCRSGDGSITISKLHREMGLLLEEPDKHKEEYMEIFNQNKTYLKGRFPTIFSHNLENHVSSLELALINNSMKGTYGLYNSDNSILYTPRTDTVRLWLTVSIKNELGQFRLSVHQNKETAMSLLNIIPGFQVMFLCKVYGDTIEDIDVCYQHEPVSLGVNLPIRIYMDDTFDYDVSNKLELYNSIIRIVS